MSFRCASRRPFHAWIAPICSLLLAACAGSPFGAPAEHVVQPGDTLYRVAQAYDVAPQRLARANALRDPDLLRVGQHLVIPDGGRLRHRVRPGESAQGVARRYGVALSTILIVNRLTSADRIRPGTELVLPRHARLPPPREVAARAPTASAPDAPRTGEGEREGERAEGLLESAESLYLSAHFEQAREHAGRAEALAVDDGARGLSARASFVRGAALAGLGDDDAAVEAFAKICDYDCGFEPPAAWVSPRIEALLEQSRARAQR